MVNYEYLVKELAKHEKETPWVEFKENKADPEEIAERISGLANSAALHKHQYGYMVWGIRDTDHALVGTSFKPWQAKKGNEDLINWLRRTMSDNADFGFEECTIDDRRFVILTVNRATTSTVKHSDIPYIRDGSVTKPLNKVPQLETALWRELSRATDELLPAKTNLSFDSIGRYIDLEGFIRLTNAPIGTTEDYLVEELCRYRILVRQDDGLFSITTMGALLFCRSLDDFPNLMRRALRIIRYDGRTSSNIIRDTVELRGYAIAFEETVRLVDLLLPSKEVFVEGVRHLERHYSDVALRELLANALIHQDLSITGKNVALEIFDDRVEISNPGTMMVDVDRIIDTEPVSRNEAMAFMMRKIGLCEELGSGWDRAVQSCEQYFLPVPTIRQSGSGTRVIIQGYASFAEMSQEERVWNCYMHACIMFVNRKCLTNSSLRSRFGLENKDSNAVMVSRVIRAAIDGKLIKPLRADAPPRKMCYVPFWA